MQEKFIYFTNTIRAKIALFRASDYSWLHFVDTPSTNFSSFHPCKINFCHTIIDKTYRSCYNGGNNQTNVTKHSG
ncbi:hypothetical protein IJI55_02560, partial [Candidatus Saccharibacteria bacterium]|nr:hypothetical protein [Candidatus Saccharibacteria bacterium]